MQAECTVLSAELSNLLDRQERSYQRICLNTICGKRELMKTTSILDTIEEMGQTKRCRKRKTRQLTSSTQVPLEDSQQWTSIIQQTNLLEQEVPSYCQEGTTLQTQYVSEEEVLQTTTCSTKDIDMDQRRTTFLDFLRFFFCIRTFWIVAVNTSTIHDQQDPLVSSIWCAMILNH